MAKKPINSILDRAAIKAELAALKDDIKKYSAEISQFLKVRANIEGASGAKELNKELTDLDKKLSDLKIRNQELANQQKEFNLAVAQEREERRKAAQERKDQIAAEKQAAKDFVNAQREKNALLAEEKRKQDELKISEEERAKAEQNRLGVPTNNQRAQLTGGNKAAGVSSFVPETELEQSILTREKLRAELSAELVARKELEKQYKAGNVAQADYDSEIVKSIALENELKLSVKALSKEIDNQAKLQFSTPDSIDAAKARVALLSQERNNIAAGGLASPEDIARIKELNAQIDAQNELIDKNSDKLARQKINIGNYPTEFTNASEKLKTELKSVNEQLKAPGLSGEQVKQLTLKQVSLSNAVTTTSQGFTTLTQATGAYKKAAIEIGNTYGTNSDLFKSFTKDVSSGSAKIVELDTNVTRSIKGGSAFGRVLSNIGQQAVDIARILPGLGIATLIGFAIEPIINLTAKLFEASEAQKKLAEQEKFMAEFQKEIADGYGKEAANLKILRAEIESVNVPMNKRLQAVKELKEQYPDYFKNLSTEKILNGEVAGTYDLAAAAILRKAQAQAASSKIAELASKQLSIELVDANDVAKTNDELRKVKDQIITIRGLSDAAGTQRVNTAASQRAVILARFQARQQDRLAEVEDIKKQQELFLKYVVDGANETIKIEKDKAGKIKDIREREVKDIREREVKDGTAESILQSQFNINKRIIQLEIDRSKAIAENDKYGMTLRMEALGNYAIAVRSMIDLETQYEIDQEDLKYREIRKNLEKEKKEKGANIKAINDQEAREFVAHAKRLNDIKSKNEFDQINVFKELNKVKEGIERNSQKSLSLVGVEEMRKNRQAFLDEERTKQEKIQKIRDEYAEKQKNANKQLLQELQTTFFAFLNDQITREEQALTRKDELNKASYDKQIAQINSLGLDEEERKRKISEIEKKAAFDSEKIEARKRELATQRARYEKAASIANIIQSTAQAVIGALSQVTTIGPAATALAFTYGAIGALQLARAISTPIPRYRLGKSKYDRYEGIAEVGDDYKSEIIQRKTGEIERTPAKPTLTYLMAGDIVHRDEASYIKSLINASNPAAILAKIPAAKQQADTIDRRILMNMERQLVLLNRKGVPHIHNHAPIETTVWYKTYVKGYKA